MKTQLKKVTAMVVCGIILATCACFAHSGGTDSQGGHYDRQTGEYHFHHGYGAHQHPGGVCPYKK